jgi:hypothetical protein
MFIDQPLASFPQPFLVFLNRAESFYLNTKHEEFVDGAIGISGLLVQGRTLEAEQLMQQATADMLLANAMPGDGEERSNQILGMIAGGNYPPAVCQHIQLLVQIKHADIIIPTVPWSDF